MLSSPTNARSPPLEKQFDSAKASAAASLSFRPHSRAELKHKLRDKGFDSALATRALDRLEELVSPRGIACSFPNFYSTFAAQESASVRATLHPSVRVLPVLLPAVLLEHPT